MARSQTWVSDVSTTWTADSDVVQITVEVWGAGGGGGAGNNSGSGGSSGGEHSYGAAVAFARPRPVTGA